MKGPLIGLEPSDSGHKPYEIRLGKDHRVYCSCPAWRYSKGVKTCKHLQRYHGKIVAASRKVA